MKYVVKISLITFFGIFSCHHSVTVFHRTVYHAWQQLWLFSLFLLQHCLCFLHSSAICSFSHAAKCQHGHGHTHTGLIRTMPQIAVESHHKGMSPKRRRGCVCVCVCVCVCLLACVCEPQCVTLCSCYLRALLDLSATHHRPHIHTASHC